MLTLGSALRVKFMPVLHREPFDFGDVERDPVPNRLRMVALAQLLAVMFQHAPDARLPNISSRADRGERDNDEQRAQADLPPSPATSSSDGRLHGGYLIESYANGYAPNRLIASSPTFASGE